jgi:hypothetical protein
MHQTLTVKTGIFYVFNMMGVISFLEGNNSCFLVIVYSPLSLIEIWVTMYIICHLIICSLVVCMHMLYAGWGVRMAERHWYDIL